MHESYDVIVIGGGHAGAEAAWAAARMNARTALITVRLEAIGRMSCNPAIGGLGKGQMVREIDALGGLMGQIIDATGIQFRMLNRRKGPAVWAPRAQADRHLYAAEVRRRLEAAANLEFVEGMVDAVAVETGPSGQRVTGVRLADGRVLTGRAVVITTGTFLRGLMHCGNQQAAGGRVGEPAAEGLSVTLRQLGLELGRLKTGTPPRVHRDSVDFARMEPQPGDDPPTPFSFVVDRITQPQIECWITYTNETVHRLIRDNLHRSPMYSGQIESRGPRYCPSIEDKVVRFADKSRHQLFLEPEGYDSERIYCNGISTSLPADVQDEMVRLIAGLEQARIVQHGYAVEYDFVPTHQIHPWLETKRIAGLFLAGQINGTSGYEEAAGQGLMAGVNAVATMGGGEPVVLGRDQAYIGVMIDDLITRPLDEPYRMFTSRAEYRLHLRGDNADARLTPIGRKLGLVDEARWRRYQAKQEDLRAINEILTTHRVGEHTLMELLRRPENTIRTLPGVGAELANGRFDPAAVEQAEIVAKYAGYLDREKRSIARFAEREARPIPARFDFSRVTGLRNEATEKLGRVSPRSLGQASRIPGLTPADLMILMVHLDR